jgi:hypothetical protein
MARVPHVAVQRSRDARVLELGFTPSANARISSIRRLARSAVSHPSGSRRPLSFAST